MKCPKCNYEADHNFEYCPYCGTEASALSVSLNPAADKILCGLNDKLFLVICILSSVACMFGFLKGGVPVIDILFTIFLWLTYAAAKKNFADEKQLKNLSGTIYANYIISVVAFILVIVMLGLSAILIGAVVTQTNVTEAIKIEIQELIAQYPIIEYIFAFVPGKHILAKIISITVSMFATIILDIVAFKKIHRFAKSVYKGIENCTLDFSLAKSARKWLFILAGTQLFGLLYGNASPVFVILELCHCATAIIAGILINKHCVPEEI